MHDACENRHAPLSCLGSESNQNIISLPGQQKREKQGPKLEGFFWDAELHVDGRNTNQSVVKHLTKGRKKLFYWNKAILNLALDEDPTEKNNLVLLPDLCINFCSLIYMHWETAVNQPYNIKHIYCNFTHTHFSSCSQRMSMKIIPGTWFLWTVRELLHRQCLTIPCDTG